MRVEDVYKLLADYNQKEASIVCGLDYTYTFYDRWVSRDINGVPFDANYPYVNYNLNNEVFPVKSCWNGLLIANAKPIVLHNVHFRMADNTKGECDASESLLFPLDYAELGYDKVFVDPNVVVYYELKFALFSYTVLPILNIYHYIAFKIWGLPGGEEYGKLNPTCATLPNLKEIALENEFKLNFFLYLLILLLLFQVACRCCNEGYTIPIGLGLLAKLTFSYNRFSLSFGILLNRSRNSTQFKDPSILESLEKTV